MEETQVRSYADVRKELTAFPDVPKMDLVSVLNKEIVVYDFKGFPSSLAEGKEFVVILAELNGQKITFNCGEVVLHQLKDVKEKLPIKTTITRAKGKRYYTLT